MKRSSDGDNLVEGVLTADLMIGDYAAVGCLLSLAQEYQGKSKTALNFSRVALELKANLRGPGPELSEDLVEVVSETRADSVKSGQSWQGEGHLCFPQQ